MRHFFGIGMVQRLAALAIDELAINGSSPIVESVKEVGAKFGSLWENVVLNVTICFENCVFWRILEPI
jgi:hypothetical protein